LNRAVKKNNGDEKSKEKNKRRVKKIRNVNKLGGEKG